MTLPSPQDKPLLSIDEAVAHGLVPSRGSAYRGAKTGELPTITFGKRVFIVTATYYAMLGLGADATEPSPSDPGGATRVGAHRKSVPGVELAGGPRGVEGARAVRRTSRHDGNDDAA